MKTAFEVTFDRMALSNSLTSVSLSRSFPYWVARTIVRRATTGSALGWPTDTKPARQHAHYSGTKGYCVCYGCQGVGRRADWTPIGALTSCFLLTHRGQHRALNNSTDVLDESLPGMARRSDTLAPYAGRTGDCRFPFAEICEYPRSHSRPHPHSNYPGFRIAIVSRPHAPSIIAPWPWQGSGRRSVSGQPLRHDGDRRTA